MFHWFDCIPRLVSVSCLQWATVDAAKAVRQPANCRWPSPQPQSRPSIQEQRLQSNLWGSQAKRPQGKAYRLPVCTPIPVFDTWYLLSSSLSSIYQHLPMLQVLVTCRDVYRLVKSCQALCMYYATSSIHMRLSATNSHLSASTLRSVAAWIMTCQCFRSSAISVVIWFLAISSFARSRHLSFGLPRFRFLIYCHL